ncbi:MAG: hypothetical protein OXC72_14455 [Roseovarius sp.]|nr:hypothetical protein [Roseovarius sp.]
MSNVQLEGFNGGMQHCPKMAGLLGFPIQDAEMPWKEAFDSLEDAIAPVIICEI